MRRTGKVLSANYCQNDVRLDEQARLEADVPSEFAMFNEAKVVASPEIVSLVLPLGQEAPAFDDEMDEEHFFLNDVEAAFQMPDDF